MGSSGRGGGKGPHGESGPSSRHQMLPRTVASIVGWRIEGGGKTR